MFEKATLFEMPIETYFAIESIYANSNEFMKNEKDILLLGGFIVYYGLQKKNVRINAKNSFKINFNFLEELIFSF